METILNRQALGKVSDLSSASATPLYALGEKIETIDDKGDRRAYIYVKNKNSQTPAKAAVTVTADLSVAAPATQTVGLIAGIVNFTVEADEYFFLQTEGKTTAVSAGATTAGNTGKLANGVTTVADESGTTETAKSVCVINTTVASAGDVTVTLINKRVQI